MARPTGTPLSGPGAAGVRILDGHRGQRLGLPAEGPGSVATAGSRLGAVLLDLVVAGLIGGLGSASTGGSPESRQVAGVVALVLMYAVLLPTAGQTIGMRLVGLRVLRLQGGLLNPWLAFVRGLLVALTVPALITDRDGRGLHDRAVGSVIVRT